MPFMRERQRRRETNRRSNRRRIRRSVMQFDFVSPYVEDLANVIDMDAISGAGIRIGVDPLGGAASIIGSRSTRVTGSTSRSSIRRSIPHLLSCRRSRRQDSHGLLQPYAMAKLVGLKDRYQVAFGNDPDADRHGIVTPYDGLMNPNHYLAVAIQLPGPAPSVAGPTDAAIGKTLVSSSLIDRVVPSSAAEKLSEVPVGFKWFVTGLFNGEFCFGGEESAGASFLRRDGRCGRPTRTG